MTLAIKDYTTATARAQGLSHTSAEPEEFENEPTEWRQYLSARRRDELDAALLDLLRFFIAQRCAATGKSAEALASAAVSRQVIAQGRNSRKEEEAGGSARAQMWALAGWCVENDCWPVVVWYEYAQSAYLKFSKPRKRHNEHFELVKARKAPAPIIVCAFPSRFTRRRSEMNNWLDEFERLGMFLYCASAEHTVGTEMRKLTSWWAAQADISQEDSVAKSEMINNKLALLLADGCPTRGLVNYFGLEEVRDKTGARKNKQGGPALIGGRLVAAENAWIVRAGELLLSGFNWNELAKELYRDGCRSRLGKMIHGTDWRRILTTPYRIGCERKNGQLHRINVEASFNDETWEQIMLRAGLDPQTGARIIAPVREQAYSYPLSRLLHCPCGSYMIGGRLADNVPYYKCSRYGSRIQEESALATTGPTRGRALDGKQHASLPAELAHRYIREIIGDAAFNHDERLREHIASLAAASTERAAQLAAFDSAIAAIDDDAAYLDFKMERQHQPGYRGERLSTAEYRAKIDDLSRERAALVKRRLTAAAEDRREPWGKDDVDVRELLRTCTDAELRVYARRAFVRIDVERAANARIAPERRIKWQCRPGYIVSVDFDEQLLTNADIALKRRIFAGTRSQRVSQELENTAYALAKRGLTTSEITLELRKDFKGKNGGELAANTVSHVVRRVMLERDGIHWRSPVRRRTLIAPEIVERMAAMREGGATLRETGTAFGYSWQQVSNALRRRPGRTTRPHGRKGSLPPGIEQLCWELRCIEGLSWKKIAETMMEMGIPTRMRKLRWYPGTAQYVVETFERDNPDWCRSRRQALEDAQAA